ncbi:hypothetical protein P3T76_006097 [Phytophthora citrophthora]|uniref:RxLR effector protein n=1 Tax=Phytophthora citrophthora TaxID=4793 RepID=A0AAD9GQW8_9STRA|nr:hypothetical protein P3T76_006097 [Phytophthora citrophthora]
MRCGQFLVFLITFVVCCNATSASDTATAPQITHRNLKGSENTIEGSYVTDEERAVGAPAAGLTKLKSVFQNVKTKTDVVNALKKMPTKITAKDAEVARQFVANIRKRTKINKKAIAITLLVFLLITGGTVAVANYTRSH